MSLRTHFFNHPIRRGFPVPLNRWRCNIVSPCQKTYCTSQHSILMWLIWSCSSKLCLCVRKTSETRRMTCFFRTCPLIIIESIRSDAPAAEKETTNSINYSWFDNCFAVTPGRRWFPMEGICRLPFLSAPPPMKRHCFCWPSSQAQPLGFSIISQRPQIIKTREADAAPRRALFYVFFIKSIWHERSSEEESLK